MRVFVLELIGMASFIAAGFFIAVPVGLAVIGVMALASAFALSRSVAKDDKQ